MRGQRGICGVLLSLIAAMIFAVLDPGSLCAQTAFDLEGRPTDPLAQAAGRITVLVFVRTDCPISNRYAPTIQKLSAEYAGRVAFWLVYPDKAETATSIRKYLQDYGYRLPALRDPQRALVKSSHAEITPEVAVFEQKHELVYHGRIDNWYEGFSRPRGAPTTHELDDAIQAALSGRRPAVASAAAVGCYISDLE